MQLVALARYEPAWHVEHAFAFTPVLYSLVPLQLLQLRSFVSLGTVISKLPAAQVRQAVQTRGAVVEPANEA